LSITFVAASRARGLPSAPPGSARNVFMLVILFKPQGLMGRKVERKV
jgi:hypothetical protein